MDAKFGAKLLKGDALVDTSSEFGDSVELIGMYFSAHWCPPCRGFTPKLVEFYNKVNAGGKRLEMVFVSHDRDDASFKSYFAEMPWLAIPFDEDDTKQKLIQASNVSGIPKLVFLNKDGSVKSEDGRTLVSTEDSVAKFPF